MLRIAIYLLVFALPIAEIYLLIVLGGYYGIWFLLYVILMGILGIRLMKESYVNLLQVQQTTTMKKPVVNVLMGARNFLAGLLLFVPGVITDVIAVVLLLIPTKNPTIPQEPAAHQTIEGEFRRED